MNNKNNNKYFKINNLKNQSIAYGFFSRLGGYSANKNKSLNCSSNSGDKKENVIRNIKLTKEMLNLNHTKTKFLNQIHSTNVELIKNKNFNTDIFADGSITLNKNISLAILTADCAPIFLFDNKQNIICALHAGWKGCLNNIIFKAIKKINNINKNNNEIIAIVGPCLSKNYFQVDENFKENFIKKNINYQKFFNYNKHLNRIYFDMRSLINFQLQKMLITRIYHIHKDTYSQESVFFSHRRATHKDSLPTGRMINIIGFKQ